MQKLIIKGINISKETLNFNLLCGGKFILFLIKYKKNISFINASSLNNIRSN
jgi:hypothetical protein